MVAVESAWGPLSTQITQPQQGAEPACKAKPKPKCKPVPSLNLCLAEYIHRKKVVVTRGKLYVDATLPQAQAQSIDPRSGMSTHALQ